MHSTELAYKRNRKGAFFETPCICCLYVRLSVRLCVCVELLRCRWGPACSFNSHCYRHSCCYHWHRGQNSAMCVLHVRGPQNNPTPNIFWNIELSLIQLLKLAEIVCLSVYVSVQPSEQQYWHATRLTVSAPTDRSLFNRTKQCMQRASNTIRGTNSTCVDLSYNLFIFALLINVSFRSEVTDRRSGVANAPRLTVAFYWQSHDAP